jgi:hypothetical protein
MIKVVAATNPTQRGERQPSLCYKPAQCNDQGCPKTKKEIHV